VRLNIININFIEIYSLLQNCGVYIFCSLIVSGYQAMLDNKSQLRPGTIQDVSTAIFPCEVLRGTFADSEGRMRHAKVDLPSEKAVLADRADPAPVVLAAEDGTVIDVFGDEYPALAVLRMTMSPPHPVAASVNPTPRYDALEIKNFGMLRSLLRRAIRDTDASLLGQVATASARIHQRRLPKPRFDVLLNIAVSFGACGLSVSYGGSGIALIFNPEKRDFYWSMQGAARALRELGICRTGHSACPGTAVSWRSV
jgi:GHMP kinases C terminal